MLVNCFDTVNRNKKIKVFFITKSNEIKDWQVWLLTFLYEGGNGEERDNKAEAAIDAQENLVQ